MKRIKILLLSMSMLIIAVPAAAEVVVNEMSEIPFGAFVPCANGGAGEVAEGVFRLHSLVRFTIDGSGGEHFGSNSHPMGGFLVGLDTGDTYRATGRTGESFNVGAGGLPLSYTFVNQFNLVGPGDAVSFTVHETFHVTVNANGDLTADVSNVRVTCD